MVEERAIDDLGEGVPRLASRFARELHVHRLTGDAHLLASHRQTQRLEGAAESRRREYDRAFGSNGCHIAIEASLACEEHVACARVQRVCVAPRGGNKEKSGGFAALGSRVIAAAHQAARPRTQS